MSAARWCLLAVCLTACGTPRRALVSSDPLVLDPALRPRVAAFEPAFTALSAALAANDEPNARAILARVRALRPDGPALDVVEAFQRILDGRAASREIELRLVVRGSKDGKSGRHLALAAVSSHGTPVKICAAAARLEASLYGVDVRGYEHRSAFTQPIDELAELELEAHDPRLLDLAAIDVPISNELAVRARFRLVLVQAQLEVDDRRLPAATLTVAPCEVRELANFLPTDPVEPAELARHLEKPGFGLPAAIERAVRIAPERRGEALELCTPVLARMNRVDLERAAPCLRWLSGDLERGGDPDQWRAWAVEREKSRETTPTLDLPTLDLGTTGRDTPPPS
ncbi:MAG: hypothetical protein K8S98_12225 [Planctomycetes bacterium]|nr:hypothetical protein [Planctomycetota bacterium]